MSPWKREIPCGGGRRRRRRGQRSRGWENDEFWPSGGFVLGRWKVGPGAKECWESFDGLELGRIFCGLQWVITIFFSSKVPALSSYLLLSPF
jgi:hypothetical protein